MKMRSFWSWMVLSVLSCWVGGAAWADVTIGGKTYVDLTTSTSGSVGNYAAAFSGFKMTGCFDGNISDSLGRGMCTYTTTYPAMYVDYKFNEPTAVNAYSIRNCGNGGASQTTRAPKTWTLEGSDDGETWTQLDEHLLETGWAYGEVRLYSFVNDHAYTYYRYSCTALNGATNALQLHEIEYYYVESLQVSDCVASSVTETGFDISATVSMATATSISAYAVKDGAEPVSTLVGTNVSKGSTATGTFTGLDADTTYNVYVVSTDGSAFMTNSVGTVYTGTLTVEKICNADEYGLTCGRIRVSRASAALSALNVPISVEGGQQGTTHVRPAAGVMIEANKTSAEFEIQPLLSANSEDVLLDVTVRVSAVSVASEDAVVEMKILNSDADQSRRVVAAGTDLNEEVANPMAVYVGGTLVLEPGTYAVTKELALPAGLSIEGQTGNPEDVVIYADIATWRKFRLMTLNDADAFVSSVVISNGWGDTGGANLQLLAGTVSNCVIKAATLGNYNQGGSVFLNGDNALLTHSVIDGATPVYADAGWGGEYGIGAQINKGCIAYTVVKNTRASTGTSPSADPKNTTAKKSAGGIYLAGAGASAVNCTVVDCSGTRVGGIYVAKDAVAKNCAVAACETRGTWEVDGELVSTMSSILADGTLSYCATDDAEKLNETCVIGTAATFFKDYEQGDFRPTALLAKKGEDKADIGAYPANLSGLIIIIR